MPEPVITDVCIIGCGPAGLQAAIHAGKLVSVCVYGRLRQSNLFNAKIDNMASPEMPFVGHQLLEKAKASAQELGVNFVEEDVLSIEAADSGFDLKTESGSAKAKAVVFATGIRYGSSGIVGEKDFVGRGVSYCADCDCLLYRGKTVGVYGGGSSAARAVEVLARHAGKVFWIYDHIELSDGYKDKLVAMENVEYCPKKITKIIGGDTVTGVVCDDGNVIDLDGVFIELGAKAAADMAIELGVALDQEQFKYINTDSKQMTNISGVFAAGDITGPPFQVAKAVGQGCIAGYNAAEYVRKQKAKDASNL